VTGRRKTGMLRDHVLNSNSRFALSDRPTTMSASPPTHLRARKLERILEVEWAGAPPAQLPFKLLRCRCPCAACVDENTGVRILDPATIPDDIMPIHLGFTGNYALKITWSDSHATGLYTWDLLAEIAQCTKSS